MELLLNWFNLNFAQASVSSNNLETESFVYERMSGIARYIYENMPSFEVAGYVVFILVFILSAIVFKLGFARELPLLKNIVIYKFLFLGCLMLTFFAFFLPMIEGLMVAALILIVYKSRMWREKREEKKALAK